MAKEPQPALFSAEEQVQAEVDAAAGARTWSMLFTTLLGVLAFVYWAACIIYVGLTMCAGPQDWHALFRQSLSALQCGWGRILFHIL